ncbi:MAG: polysaccharide deacetylase family protein [Clostridiales Family XIII bacterium]|jgi:peptidoglycan/xylan/chitin deacetylase (PgdA/CDA1 family)|nr:polysaccharide deacetylase family protein [Clostridiales Family XIII bacterium]
MKRGFVFVIVLLIAMMTAVGCSESKDPVLEDEAQEDERAAYVISDQPTYEYGDPNAIIDNNKYANCYLLYPKTDSDEIDDAIDGWAQKLYVESKETIDALREEDDSAEGELNIQYNAFLVGDYAGVEEIGFFSHTAMAHPQDFVQTFNIDVDGNTLIRNDEILDVKQESEVLKLLRNKVLTRFPELKGTVGSIDGTWLRNIVLNHKGVDVLLERGIQLPSYIGLQKFTLTYEELGAAYILPNRGSTPAEESPPEEPPAEEPPQNAVTTENIRTDLDPAGPMVALTFDDGPSNETPRILKLLAQYGGRATFCVVGSRVEAYQDIARQAAAQQCQIIGHSWDHKQLTKLSDAEVGAQLARTNEVIYRVTGQNPVMYRPPYGAADDRVKNISAQLQLALVNWSLDTKDWKTRNADQTYRAIMNNVGNGNIVLCHDLYAQTAEAMERVIPELVQRGYQLVTISELLHYSGNAVTPGQMYNSGRRG